MRSHGWTPEVHDIVDDEKLVLDLLLEEKILLTQGVPVSTGRRPTTCGS